MKRITTVLGALLLTVGMHAQDRNTEKADRLYNSMEYVDAAKEYEDLAAKGKGGDYVYRQLADSYYNVFNTKSAVQWYAKVVQGGKADAETHYRYAQMLKAEGKYEEANKQMAQFAKLAPQDDRAVAFTKDPDYLPRLRSQAKLYTEKSLTINSPESDFGPILNGGDNNLYFASARNKARRTAGWDDQPYLDLYQAVMNADGTFAEATPVSGDVNTRWHEGPATFSPDGNTMYYSSESFLEKEYEKEFANKQRNKNRIKKSQTYLYMATKSGNGWGNVKELPFNGKEHSNRTPSLSKDGRTLYFASDMPGGKGGFDIFRVSVNGDGTFGVPEAVNQVNTEGNEGFPFIGENDRLYFSSDAHKGFGGLDVFYWDMKKADGVKNVGAPVNTAKDDFAFSFSAAKNIGFVSSNRNGNDDIFQLVPVCATEVNTTVKDAVTGKPLADARVAILDDRNNVIETRTTQANGQVGYTVDCGKTYTIQASKDGYEPGSFAVAKTDGKAQEIPADLKPIESIVKEDQIVLNEIYFEYDKSNITKEGAFELDKLVQVMGKYPALVVMVKAHTDNRGSDAYNMALSERRARATVQYVLSKGIARERISGKGYGESEPKVACGEGCTEEQHQQNRRSEFLIVKK